MTYPEDKNQFIKAANKYPGYNSFAFPTASEGFNINDDHYTTYSIKSSKKKVFSCEYCSYKTYHSLSHLIKHQRIHTGEKPYGCTICGARFADISNLNTHDRRMHAGAQKKNTYF